MLSGAIIIGISLFICSRSGKQYIKKQQMKWLFTISWILLGAYSLLIMLWINKIVPAEALSGGFALVCSCLIAFMAAGNKAITNRLREEIAELDISKKKINDLSLTDQPTNLYNRRGFISIVEKNLIRLRRQKEKAILFYIELNNLQVINEKSGYKEGDAVLAKVGTLMTSTFRQADVIARIGDDEFIAFLVDAAIGDMETINNNFKANLQKYNEKRSSLFKLSVSFAISSFDPVVNESAYEMISQASASVKLKKKRQNSKRIARSENKNSNFTLIVSNMCSTNGPVDMKIHIDGELAVDDTFDTGLQNAWKPFHFKLAAGKHDIKAKSVKGRATLIQEFEIKKDHWASIEYRQDDESGSRSTSGKLSFHMHDVPLEHQFVRPVKK
jgi:diguanylate cyclase (GGDEF)-like protein